VTYLVLGEAFRPLEHHPSLYYACAAEPTAIPSRSRPATSALFMAWARVSRDFDGSVYADTRSTRAATRIRTTEGTGSTAPRESQIAGRRYQLLDSPAVPLIARRFALSGRTGCLRACAREDQGQSNFTNPAWRYRHRRDFDISPRWRVIGNLNQLWFANNHRAVRFFATSGNIDRNLGHRYLGGVQYRPLFTQNIVLNASAAALIAGKGLKQLYDADSGKTQYSILFNVLLTF